MLVVAMVDLMVAPLAPKKVSKKAALMVVLKDVM